jgi:predicted membrane protein
MYFKFHSYKFISDFIQFYSKNKYFCLKCFSFGDTKNFAAINRESTEPRVPILLITGKLLNKWFLVIKLQSS